MWLSCTQNLCWVCHRRCASVTKEQYTILSDSTEPFVCPSCTIAGQQAAITCLQECFSALIDEVRALKANVAELQQSALEKAGSKVYKQQAEPHREGNKSGASWSTAQRRAPTLEQTAAHRSTLKHWFHLLHKRMPPNQLMGSHVLQRNVCLEHEESGGPSKPRQPMQSNQPLVSRQV